MRFLLLLFIIVPITEMWILIQVGSEIGALNTIFLVFITAAIGLALLRKQGVDTLLRLNQRLEQGQMPAAEIMEGVALAVGGALLLTPGFITDAFGFICLLPMTRKALLARVVGQVAARMHSASMHGDAPKSTFNTDKRFGANNASEDVHREEPTTIEGEFKREDK